MCKGVIGTSEEPIRALTFPGGRYATAMQLGTAHALLVSRGRAPDVVAGISAGAVNAVALAEILQAGAARKDPTEVRPEQVTVFRRIYEAYRRSPGAMAASLLPDSLQIDTRRPLEPMKLPIHVAKERDFRDASSHTRSGLMNIYNALLRLRLPVGTITRIVRRVLGTKQARELPSAPHRAVAYIAEVLHLLAALGLNLARLAPLGTLVFKAAVRAEATPPDGGTAGELISRPVFWEKFLRGVASLLSLLVLAIVWLLAVGLAVAIGGPISLGCWTWLIGVRLFGWLRRPKQWGRSGVGPALRGARRVVQRGLVLLLNLFTCVAVWAGLWVALLAPVLWSGAFPSWLRRTSLALGILCGALAVISTGLVIARRKTLLLNVLRRNDINRSLFSPHAVRQLFVRLFDPTYYGEQEMRDVVDAALNYRAASEPQEPRPKRLNHYVEPGNGAPPMRVSIMAANVGTGELEALSDATPVVDALLAATAVVPLFPAQTLDGSLYVDGSNVANEVSWPLREQLLRRVAKSEEAARPGDVNPKASSLHVYNVTPLPLSARELEPDDEDKDKFRSGAHVPLVDVVVRAVKLQMFRDATLERRLAELPTRAMPVDGGICYPSPSDLDPGSDDSADADTVCLRTWFYPIEPDRTLSVDRRLLEAPDEEGRRRVIAETVAAGCRATLERMLHERIRGMPGKHKHPVACREVIAARLDREKTDAGIPGSDADSGPGLAEVCRHCSMRCKPDGKTSKTFERRLGRRPTETNGPADWPLAAPSEPAGQASDEKKSKKGKKKGPTSKNAKAEDRHAWLDTEGAKERWLRELEPFREHWEACVGKARPTTCWPAPRDGRPASGAPTSGDRPPVSDDQPLASRSTVSLLFSGGVFRGVFQVGVMSALSELDLRPDIVAGASIGSITAAMAGRLFAGSANAESRAETLRDLAATYMAIDRLVITDRFADFVRTVTVRAAQARLSLRQFDRFARLYDKPGAGAFSREARTVVAGLERLFYISPFELHMLFRAARLRRRHRVVRLLRDYFQEWLERGSVGDEILGAEPLSLLIEKHVLEGSHGASGGKGEDPRPAHPPTKRPKVDAFLEDGIAFLATATNLNAGRLETFGKSQLGKDGADREKASLREAMLASSAFPGIFRPRWCWEVHATSSRSDLLADGGVMDNLPFDAITEFLDFAAKARLIHAAPKSGGATTPHLIFSASLRADPPKLDEATAIRLADDWRALFKRTRQLGYNQKLRRYARTQRTIRRIVNANRNGRSRVDPDLDPLALEVVTVRPKWLCGTLAFHPMLGFRRREQARSIAHGCASTLWQLGAYALDPARRSWLEAWGVDLDRVPSLEGRQCGPIRPIVSPGKARKGRCWFRENCDCPFASQSTNGGRGAVAAHVSAVHRVCGEARTHEARD